MTISPMKTIAFGFLGLSLILCGCAPRSVEVRHITVEQRKKAAPKAPPKKQETMTPSNYPVINSYDQQKD